MVVVCARKRVIRQVCLVTTNMDERRVAYPQGQGHFLYDTLSPHAFISWRRRLWFGLSVYLTPSIANVLGRLNNCI